jgi:enoyl-CoA hydratase/carnithine racemase
VPVEFQRQGRVALITLNRPKTMNAISLELLDRIDEHLDAVAAEPEIGAVVITGSGKAFTAGADVGHMRGATPLEARAFAQRGHALTGRIEEFPKPVIAAVNGYALGGGCELALACDMRLAAESAQFGLPELKLGIMPGWGGTQRLARLHSDGALLDAAIGLADEISSRPPAALAAAKDLVNRALDGDRSGNLAREVDSFALAFTTEDAREGIEAFFEKRDPRFTGR